MDTSLLTDKKEQLSSCELYTIHENGSIDFTIEGCNYYKPYFHRMGIKFSHLNSAGRLKKALTLIRPLEEEARQPLQTSAAYFLELRHKQALNRLDFDTAFRLELQLFELSGRALNNEKSNTNTVMNDRPS